MKSTPLAQNFAPGTRIKNFVGRHTSKMIARHVTHAIATGLDRMHLDLGERRQNIGGVFEPGGVELKILSGAEVTPPFIPSLGDITERPELPPREGPVRNGDAQHGRMTLDIEPIL